MEFLNCEHPKVVRNRYTHEIIQIPCGECPSCAVRRISRWVAPLVREATCHRFVFFFTLTYANKFLPVVDLKKFVPQYQFKSIYEKYYDLSKEYLEFVNYKLPVLSSSDVQKFVKRLRENIFLMFGKRFPIRYFIAGDIGGTTFRPHYHGILFFDEPRIADNIELLFGKSWSVQIQLGKRELLGRYEVEPAIGAASYCSQYIQTIGKCPSIYFYREFKPKFYHSSCPPLGSLVSPLEDINEVVTKGLTQITLYDPHSFSYKKTTLSNSVLFRLFPTIPSFKSLSISERLQIYRILDNYYDREPTFRRLGLLHVCEVNSFFYQYITLGRTLDTFQLIAKLDRVYYAFNRLKIQSSSFGVSLLTYDGYIENYFKNVNNDRLKLQFDYENYFLTEHPHEDVNLFSLVDAAYYNNQRGLKNFKPSRYVSPLAYNINYFLQMRVLRNKLIKRKCNNAYLEKHPEFKQFHS